MMYRVAQVSVRRFLPIAVALAAVAASPAAIARPAIAAGPTAAERALLTAEDARFRAMIARDSAAVASGMADEAIYTHATGRVQNKEDHATSIANGRTDYRTIMPVNRTVRVSGDLGYTHASLQMTVGTNNLPSAYLAIYVRRAGRWQLLFWQTSPGPQGLVVPPGMQGNGGRAMRPDDGQPPMPAVVQPAPSAEASSDREPRGS